MEDFDINVDDWPYKVNISYETLYNCKCELMG